jgi:hypothetical protein
MGPYPETFRMKKHYLTEGTLSDKIYKALSKIPEFKNLSMDRQGEIIVKVSKMIGGK